MLCPRAPRCFSPSSTREPISPVLGNLVDHPSDRWKGGVVKGSPKSLRQVLELVLQSWKEGLQLCLFDPVLKPCEVVGPPRQPVSRVRSLGLCSIIKSKAARRSAMRACRLSTAEYYDRKGLGSGSMPLRDNVANAQTLAYGHELLVMRIIADGGVMEALRVVGNGLPMLLVIALRLLLLEQDACVGGIRSIGDDNGKARVEVPQYRIVQDRIPGPGKGRGGVGDPNPRLQGLAFFRCFFYCRDLLASASLGSRRAVSRCH